MKRSISHAMFTIEKTYNAPPARVWKAFADKETKRKWFGGPPEWSAGPYEMDFRVGGFERESGGPKGGPTHYFVSRFEDIVPNERIITTYEMRLDDTRISVSVATVELEPTAKGTKMTFTEMGAYLDGHDPGGKMRREGTAAMLDAIAKIVEE
jgi:uncharacterized protein YndB with AHSA1/START domain